MRTEYAIRRLGPEDAGLASRAVALFKSLAPGDPERFLGDPDHYLFVAEVAGDGLAGWAYGYKLDRPDGRSMVLIYEIDVSAPHRRTGVGTTLVTAILDEARTSGCDAGWVVTELDNTAAQRLYDSTGAERAPDHALLRWDLR